MHAMCIWVIIEWPKPFESGPLSWNLKREAKQLELQNRRAHVPKLHTNLLLVSKFLSNGLKV